MNINQEALYHYLKSKDIKTEFFFLEDYKLIADKSLAYKNKNKEFPSINFLLEYSDKLSEDSEQKDRIEDILYALSKYKPELESVQEVNELLLQEFKTESIKKLTKQIASALLEGNENRITLLSQKINDVSKIELGGEDFRENDIKRDIEMESISSDLIPSGFFPSSHPSLSQIRRGSLISLIADTGLGKSVLVIQAVLEQYLAGYDTCYISYEMPKTAVLGRMLSNIASVPITEIDKGEYSCDEAELRIKAGKAVLKYEINFDKAFSRVLKGKGFEDCKVRTNYLKILAIASAGDDSGIDELPDNEEILKIIEEHKPTFLTIDLISEVKIKKSLGSYETDLSEFARELNRLALRNSSVIIIVSQPSSSSVGGLIFPKYAKSLRSSASSNILIASTQEMLKDKVACVIVEKCRHNMRGITIAVEQDFNYMRFNLLDEEIIRMEDFFNELAKDFKKKGNDK